MTRGDVTESLVWKQKYVKLASLTSVISVVYLQNKKVVWALLGYTRKQKTKSLKYPVSGFATMFNITEHRSH